MKESEKQLIEKEGKPEVIDILLSDILLKPFKLTDSDKARRFRYRHSRGKMQPLKDKDIKRLALSKREQ